MADLTADDLPSVSGRMESSIADFERRCLVQLADEQAKPLPDNALIATLCAAVRLARECQRPMRRFTHACPSCGEQTRDTTAGCDRCDLEDK